MSAIQAQLLSLNSVECATAPPGILEQFLVKHLLEGYAEGCRYLRRAEVNMPVGRGVFKADYTFTTTEASDVGHFSAFEHVVMFNQLSFITFAKGFLEGWFHGAPPVNVKEFKELQKLGMYILGMDSIRYVKSFPANEEFPAEIEVLDYSYRADKCLFITRVRSNFCDGKAVGDFTLALKRWDLVRESQTTQPASPALSA